LLARPDNHARRGQLLGDSDSRSSHVRRAQTIFRTGQVLERASIEPHILRFRREISQPVFDSPDAQGKNSSFRKLTQREARSSKNGARGFQTSDNLELISYRLVPRSAGRLSHTSQRRIAIFMLRP